MKPNGVEGKMLSSTKIVAIVGAQKKKKKEKKKKKKERKETRQFLDVLIISSSQFLDFFFPLMQAI